MVHLLVTWALSAAALALSPRVFQGVRLRGDFADALWVAALYAVLAYFMSWFLFVFLGFATLGLGFAFQFVTELVVAAIVLRVTSALSSRFDLDGFVPALGTAFFLALAHELASRVG